MWSLTDKSEHIYHDLLRISTKFSNMRCPNGCPFKPDIKCEFCSTRMKSLAVFDECLDRISVTPLYKMQLNRSFHDFSSYAYPKYCFTYPDVAALQKSLTVFDCQIFNCQASVISEISHKKLKLAFQMIHSLSHPECSDDEKSESTCQSNLNELFIASQ